MRIKTLLMLPLLAALMALPGRAPAQVNIQVRFGARLGPEVGVSAYSSERQGDWRHQYRSWTPVTLYDVNGRFYQHSVDGARPVSVYLYNNEYFFPPQDQGWVGTDKRYNYKHRPNHDDYDRGRAPGMNVRVDPRLGAEIGVLAYSSDRAGDWRRNVRRWTPVTVYEVNGRYFPNRFGDARAVELYRYRDEYFLPPTDQAWVGFDKRYDYKKQPNSDDRDRVRGKP